MTPILQNPYIIFFLLIIAWLGISQLIAWLITPKPKNQDAVVAVWAGVFMAPILLCILFVGYADLKLKQWGYKKDFVDKYPEDIEL